MRHIKESTYQEKVEMYNKIEKDKLIEMLIEANRIIDSLTQKRLK